MQNLGYEIFTTKGTHLYFLENGISTIKIEKISTTNEKDGILDKLKNFL